MLTLRKSQWALVQEPRVALLAQQLAPILCAHWPQKAEELGDGLEADLELGIRAFLDLGFCADRDIAELLNARWALGPGFPSDPSFAWVDSVLADPGLDDGQKVARIRVQVSRQLRSQARISG